MWNSLRLPARSLLCQRRHRICGLNLPIRTGLQNSKNYVARSVATLLDDFDTEEVKAEAQKLRETEIRDALDKKTGRLWSDPWDLEDMLNSKSNFDDLLDFSPELVSRVSQERVTIHPEKIPTLAQLATLPLPPPPPPHPGLGYTKAYALHRKRAQYKHIQEQIRDMAQSRIAPIQALASLEERQDAVDALFEEIECELKEKEAVLSKHPSFGSWVERALEEYLRNIQKESKPENAGVQNSLEDDDASSAPVFMDCFGPEDSLEEAAPKILSPLTSDPRETIGRMVEEWELSAHDGTKRIMLRQSTRKIAQVLQNSEHQAARIFVCGRQGVGKTAALAALVASARKSGHIVLYLPYGDQMHKNGFYLEPNARRKGIFDLPVLSQTICRLMLESHENDLKGFKADTSLLQKFFTEDQMELIPELSGGSLEIVDALRLGTKKTSFAAMCYSVAIDVLMNQDRTPFLMVLDEFNCYFEPGHYYHAAYDENVKRPVPYEQISLFKPCLDAMAISTSTEHDDEVVLRAPICMKKGAIIVASTESHAVARNVTEGLIANVKKQVSKTDNSDFPVHLVDVPRLSSLEVEHMLANYEATGIGKLRLDKGETVMNEQEVAYLRVVSGGVAQKLMDACII